MFCKAYNMKKHGSAVVEVEVEQDTEKRSWWGKNGRRANQKKGV